MGDERGCELDFIRRPLLDVERDNPWRKTPKTPFLKLEKENFDSNSERLQTLRMLRLSKVVLPVQPGRKQAAGPQTFRPRFGILTGSLHNCRLAAQGETEMERRFAAMDF